MGLRKKFGTIFFQPKLNITFKLFYKFNKLCDIISCGSTHIVIFHNISLHSAGIQIIRIFFPFWAEYQRKRLNSAVVLQISLSFIALSIEEYSA